MKLINKVNKDFIEIADEFVIAVDDFLIIEIPKFYWGTHSHGCTTCKAFIENFSKGLVEWILEIKGKYYMFEPNDFGKIDYFKNAFTSIISAKFSGSKCKFKIKGEIIFTEESLKEYEALEEYEICNLIKEEIKIK